MEVRENAVSGTSTIIQQCEDTRTDDFSQKTAAPLPESGLRFQKKQNLRLRRRENCDAKRGICDAKKGGGDRASVQKSGKKWTDDTAFRSFSTI